MHYACRQPTVIEPVLIGTSSIQVLPGARVTGRPSAPTSTTGAASARLLHVAGTVRPPVATSASPVPTITVSGTGLPAGSVNPVSLSISIRRTTTFFARNG